MEENIYNYIYFNITHDNQKNYEIYLSQDYTHFETLEKIEEMESNSQSGPLITKFYRFHIIPDNLGKEENGTKYKIEVCVKDENNKEYKYNIKFNDIDKDFYEYNFKIEEIDVLPLDYEKQFEIYKKILREKYKKLQKTKENDYFILSAQMILEEEDIKYNFSFYLLFILECFSTELFGKQILLFNPNKIKGVGEFPKKEPLQNILKRFYKNPNNIHIESEDSRQKVTELFYTIVLYININLNYDQNKIDEMFENEEIVNYLYNQLITYQKIFSNLKISENYVTKLLDKAKSYDEILIILFYLGRNCFQFINYISSKRDLIFQFYDSEINKIKNENIKGRKLSIKIPLIEIENYVEPRIEDDIDNINQAINHLCIYDNINFIKFSPSVIEKYIEFNDKINLDNLIKIKNIIESILKKDSKFKCKYEIDQVIHENGLLQVKNGTLKNNKLLDFIQSDDYYQNKKYKKKNRPLNIFDGIDIKSLEDTFFKKWKKITFHIMFEDQFKQFLEKIASLVSNMKDFNLLFQFFDSFEEKSKNKCVEVLQNRYKEIFYSYIADECPDFIKNTSRLIYLSDKYEINIKKFLKEGIQRLLDANGVNNIYIYLTENYLNLSNECSKIIVEYFTKSKENSNPSSLIFLIQNCKNFRKNIFSNINNYIIRDEEEFFSPQETKNYKFLKEILMREIFKIEGNEDSLYILETLNITALLKEKIKNLQINYKTLIYFFEYENEDQAHILEARLKDRILCIFLYKEKDIGSYLNNIKNKMKEIKNKINFFKIIYNYFLKFYPNSKSKDIDRISSIILNLKNNNLTYYDTNYTKEYQYYLKFLEEVKKRENMMKSHFFNAIFKELGNKYKLAKNDEKYLKEIDNEFNKLKILFKDNGINKIDKKFLILCAKLFKNNEDKLKPELEKIIEILNIQFNNIDNLKSKLLLLSKKEYIFNTASSMIILVNQIGAKNTGITNDFKKIMESLQKNQDIGTIENASNILEKSGIKINDKNTEYIDVLIRFKNQPEIINFLFQRTIQECRNLQEVISENENNFVSQNDILDMEKCVEFFNDFGKKKDLSKKSDIEIINLFKTKFYQHNQLHIYFDKFFINYSQIYLLLKTLDKSESLKYKINSLFNNATFILMNSKKDSFKYINNEFNDPEKITNEYIISLRDRAQLSKIITPQFKFCIELISEIINIYKSLQDIFEQGYPKKILVKVVILNKENNENKEVENKYKFEKEYFFDDKKQKDYKEIIEKLNNILINLKLIYNKSYEEIPIIRYIYGRQFNLLYDYFHKIDNVKVTPLLKYITNDLYKKEFKDFQIEENEDLIKSNIKNCEKYLNGILQANNLNLEKIYKSSIIKKIEKKEKYEGIYIYFCEKLEKDLFQIYKYLTDNNPSAQNILLCNKDIKNEEIASFFYRAILCEYNSCFIITGIEMLKFEQKLFIIELLNHFFPKEDEKIKSCIIFLYTTKNSDLIANLDNKKYSKTLKLERKNFEDIKYDENDIEIIKSDKSGVGKSTEIKKEIEEDGKNLIYFPFGGVLNQNDIILRLKNLNIDDNCVLHLDLYDTDQISLMMGFLVSILITRFYGKDDDIFFLSKNIKIKVEIPNTFIDFFEKFPILTLFSTKEMKITNLPKLIVPKILNSNIQIVANYLKDLEENKIIYYDLIFPKITPEYLIGQKISIKIQNKNEKRITSKNAEIISDKECQKLIFDAIKDKIPHPTYYQIISFINVLAIQLKKFNQNTYLNAYQLLTTKSTRGASIRNFIVESFIKLTMHFTEGAFTDLLKNQENTHKIIFGKYNENYDIDNAVNDLANNKHKSVSFNEIDPSLIFFHEGTGENFSIITNKKSTDKEYIDLLNLINSQTVRKKELVKELPNYKKYTQIQFLQELKEILRIDNPIKKGINNQEKISLEEIAGNYVFTADNFVKMILILIRIRSKIPVIMMGETGCGKTALIRKLSEMKNNGNSEKLKILNIHAGTNEQDIIYFINTIVIPESEKVFKEEKEQKEKNEKIGLFFEETKIWVFLDEINTCKSMGLISELLCKHTCQGKPLPSNIVFIAACNPYRQKETKENEKEENIGLDINQAHQQKKFLNEKELEDIKYEKNNKLVYTVNPLPHSLLNFVFDFGNLGPDDEKEYIRCIIKESLQKVYYNGGIPKDEDNEDEKLKRLKELASKMIIESQNYIRTFTDKSAVSLREIRRFNIFYEFFYQYLKNKKKIIENEKQTQLNNGENDFYLKLDDYSLQVYAINLSIFVSYYLRIQNKEKRKGLYTIISNIFHNFDRSFKDKDFLELPLNEEKYIMNNIKIDKGIAKNRALLENIFSLFVAINTYVPIFIVGKPGCSKSLSVQLLIKSMLGNTSEKALFKKLPKIIVYSYQGSISSTSKGVENVFSKARTDYHNLEKENKKDNIPLIFFDEMGLAEYSPHNPLKVIHAELEYDQNKGEKRVAFVGISNWTLDAAKMNRGISISIPEPDEEDNEDTALTIGKSFDEELAEKNESFLKNLGKAYSLYKEYLKQNHNLDGNEDFHGNRDFYHLIKNTSKNMIIKDKNNMLNEQNLLDIAIGSIERNFSGIEFRDKNMLKQSSDIFIELFKEKIYKECPYRNFNILNTIKENINDLDSRYLLIISKSSLSTYLISSLLSNEKNEINFYIGSKFKDDLIKEEYAIKVLNKIQSYMERKNILILKNLDSVYPSMYDLFNQNFTVISEKNYARLAVGSNINSFAYVNKEFRCIVNVDIDKIGNEEPPFLNRFEKQILSLENIFDEELIKESQNIQSILNDLVIYDKNIYKRINYDLSNLLINCKLDEIQGMMYEMYKIGKNKEEMIEYILSKIALTLPQDILINMRINGFMQKYSEYFNKIVDFYGKGEHSNFANFLKTMNNYKNVVYTFSNNLEKIKNINNIKNSLLGLIQAENIKHININSLKSESELEGVLDDYYNEENEKICIIKFLPYEGDFMEYIKSFIENKETEINKQKAFIFIMYMARISNKELDNMINMGIKERNEIQKNIIKESLSNLSGYYQIFIDNLNGKDNIKLHEIIKSVKINDLLKKCYNLDELLYKNILENISYIQYNILSPYKGINQNNYITKLTDFIANNNKLLSMMNECILNQLQKEEDIFCEIFKEENKYQENYIDIFPIIQNNLYEIYITKYNLLFFLAEKDQLFSSLLSNEENQKEDNENKEEINLYKTKIIDKICKIYFDNLNLNDKKIKVVQKKRGIKINIRLGLNIPGIQLILDNIIKKVQDNIIKKYIKNEDSLRDYLDDEEEIEKVKQQYLVTLKEFNNDLYNLINKESLLRSILDNCKDDKNLIYDLILNDYFNIFINNTFKIKKQNKQNKLQENILNNIDNSKRLLNFIINIRNNIICAQLNQNQDEEDILLKLAKTINWIESYSHEIKLIQQIFFKLSLFIPELNAQIEKIINEKQIKFEISSRNPEYTSIVNEVFFLSLDSILRVITSKEEIYELPSQDFFELININKDILQDALQLETRFNMRSQEVYSLQEILKLINAFNEIKMSNEEKIKSIKKIIEYFAVETACNNEKRQKKLMDNLKGFYQFLVDKLEKENKINKSNFYKLIGFIFMNEYIKITYPSFRELLVDIILENNELIKNSSGIIKLIIESTIDISTEEMINNLDSIANENISIFKKINNSNNIFLDEVIMNILEAKIRIYFELLKKENIKKKDSKVIKDKEGIIFNSNSLSIFKQTIQFLDSISNINENNEDEKNEHFTKLYCIVYIKMYLNQLVYFIKEKQEQLGDIKNIMKAIQEIKNKKFGNVIKIYIFKLLYSYINNFEKFKKFDFKKSGIYFYSEFPSLAESDNQITLKYFFLPLDDEDYKNYLEEMKIFEKIKENNFKSNGPSQKSELIEDHGLNIFLDITINKIISNLALNYSKDNEEYKNFSNFAKPLFESIEDFNNELKELLLLFYDENIYAEKLRPKLVKENEIINLQLFESILYGFKFCVNSLNNKNIIGKCLFGSFFKKDCLNIINKCFLPGIDSIEDMHLVTLDDIICHLNKGPPDFGCYVCSCGFYYNIDPCGFPTIGQTFNCPECSEPLGYGEKIIPTMGAEENNHGMVIRDGHFRIFKDEGQKQEQMEAYGEIDENFPNLTLAEYKLTVIEPIKQQTTFGFYSISRQFFENQNKNLRNLSIIGYRLLNYICYCHLFFAYCLDYISEKDLQLCLIQGMDILKIIETNWILLKQSLQKKNINSIQIFMNEIFKKLSGMIRNCSFFKGEEERENFEESVEQLIEECIKDYPSYSIKYNEENQKQLNVDILDIKSIIAELIPVTEENYPEKDYPMMKYFILTKYKSKEDLAKRMENNINYPLINQILLDNPDNYKMKYLLPFNEFVNYMVENYSLKISRDDAKKKILENEEIYQNEEFKKKFYNFIKAWNQIKNDAKKYQCRKEMPIKDLSEKDKLIYFLNDDGDYGGGMYLAAACQNFISFQNTFLTPIIDANAFNGILNCYIDNIRKSVPLNEAKNSQILLIKERFEKSQYNDFEDVIYNFSERNIFLENGKINYSDYNSFVYDYDSIEEELGKIILPGVCLFNSKELNFIAFSSEGFRGGHSQIFAEFYSKYPQQSLDEKEKAVIINYIQRIYQENNNGYDFKDFFSSMQMIIFYLNEKGIIRDDSKINVILNNSPRYLKISDDCKNFFSKEGNQLSVNKIMNVYCFIEHLCFDEFEKNLLDEYKAKIPDEIRGKLKEKLLNEKVEDNLYNIKELGAAIRRYISRYLAGKAQLIEIKRDRNLSYELTRIDLWDPSISNNENFENIITNQFKDFNLIIGNIYDLYLLIGEEDKKSINFVRKNENRVE